MAPETRCSAPSTPSTPSTPRASIGPGGLITPPNSTLRRIPHCTKCHRPRAGHPRSGCPYVDASDPPSPSTTKPISKGAQASSAGDDGISEDLSSLHIVDPTQGSGEMPVKGKDQRRLSVRFALVPQETLASLGTTDSELVRQLLQPGMMSDDLAPGDLDSKVLSWRRTLHDGETVDGPTRSSTPEERRLLSSHAGSSLSRRMPCTLTTPTASLTVTEPLTDQGIGGSAIDMNETIYFLPDLDVKKPKPLVRSMSAEQRSLFLDRLSHSSSTAPATLLSISLSDVDNVRSDAEQVGFIVRVLPNQEDDKKWVILGSDQKAVDLLADKFTEEERKNTRAKGKGGKFKAVAGGVVVGAVATWTGLAFS
ncbi:hypothetical protein PAXRUDRAFT_832583 [Paxillus rubicundulus Ve08.2h10]|uniref:Uncharacterized protein n=1 Tax=Paxillus rubicundulus Ve08.2h10 TaxID=930991 RepID=A0A0D0D1B8_9AGAM|nr:hypothetical protein PAXRUDRAFT_832583 [Paxillus rubicundulus Ve08.2h10]